MNNDVGDNLQINKHGKFHQNVGDCIYIFQNVFIGRPPDLPLTLPTSKCSNWCPWLAKMFYNFQSLIPFQKSFELTWCIYKIWFSDCQIRDHLYVYLSFKSCSTLLAWSLARLCSPWSYKEAWSASPILLYKEDNITLRILTVNTAACSRVSTCVTQYY